MLARAADRDGRTDEARELVHRAWTRIEHARIDRIYERIYKSRPPARSTLLHQRMPVDYVLPRDAGGRVALAAALDSLPPGGLLLVCLLADYRTNGPYNDFLSRLQTWSKVVGPRLALHAITLDRALRYAEAAAEAEAELSERMPVNVLLGDGRVHAGLDPTGSPHVYAVDRTGRIVHTNVRRALHIWQALAAADGAEEGMEGPDNPLD